MRRPLVAIDALLLRPRPTGVGRAILDWTAALAAERRAFDVAVLCTHPEMFGHLAGRPGWRVIACPAAGGGNLRKALWTQLALPRLLRGLRADLLHSLQFVAPLRPPCPSVVTVFDLGYLLFPGCTEQPRRSYYRFLVPRSLRNAAAVACISRATAAEVRARFPAVADRIRITPLGVPAWVDGRPAPDEPKPDDAPFLFVGTLEPRKNIERLLLAYRDLRRLRLGQGRDCPQLVVVGGRGWQDRSLRRLLAAMVDEGGVVARDYCGQDDLWRQYRLARALLLPSLHEGFGLPILEAMAAGTPVLTSGIGAMAEVAGEAALLVDPFAREAVTEGMRRLLDDEALRRRLVARGRRNLDRWTWAATVRETCRIYQDLLARPARAATDG